MGSLQPDRLSALDAAFLAVEGGPLHMHVGGVAIFEGGGLVRADGSLDFAAVRSWIAGSIEAVPRFREHVRPFPPLGTVWSPDPHFRLEHHVHHAAIPHPGTLGQLHALAGELFSVRLDRERPLWDMTFVEGLSGGRFAMILKVHHAMLDGVAGMALLAALFSFASGPIAERQPSGRDLPTEPTAREFMVALLEHRVGKMPELRDRLRHLLSPDGRGRAEHAVRGLLELAKSAVKRSDAMALNPEHVGSHRVFGGAHLPLDELKRVRRALGGTINDVALAAVTAALRKHLGRRGVDPDSVGELRALVPVSLRPKDATDARGNRVASLIVHLPISEKDPVQRLAKIREHTETLKHGSHEAEAVALVEELSDLGPEGLMGAVFGAALNFLPFHLIVTNVPGPQVPLYLGPAKLTEIYPMVPLFARQSVGIAIASYDGRIFVGVNGSPEAVPDLDELSEDIAAAGRELGALVPHSAETPRT